MKIVKFKNGKFGIRRWCFGYEYMDLKDKYWWRLGSIWMRDCQDDIDTVKSRLNVLTDKGIPI